MICSFVLGMYPQNAGEKIYKYINYDYFKNIFKEELSNEELKQITVSNFLTKDKFFENKTYYMKVSSINSECTLKILKLLFFYKITNHIISIKDTDFKITNIYHNSIWSKQLILEDFFDKQPKTKIELKFFTPVFFKIGNKYISSLEPIYVFKNIIKKFKNSSICNNKFLEIIKNFDIKNIKRRGKFK